MKRSLREFFGSLPLAAQGYLLVLALSLPVAALASFLRLLDLHAWTALVPALVWQGQLWRLVTYAFLPSTPIDWFVSLFWSATLVSLLARSWTGSRFWFYNLLCALGGALGFVLLKPNLQIGIVGCYAMICGLLVAWDRFHRYERLLLLGIGEVSVRQAAILIVSLNSLIMLFSAGGIALVSMWCGGLAGWIHFWWRERRLINRASQAAPSERIARLEL